LPPYLLPQNFHRRYWLPDLLRPMRAFPLPVFFFWVWAAFSLSLSSTRVGVFPSTLGRVSFFLPFTPRNTVDPPGIFPFGAPGFHLFSVPLALFFSGTYRSFPHVDRPLASFRAPSTLSFCFFFPPRPVGRDFVSVPFPFFLGSCTICYSSVMIAGFPRRACHSPPPFLTILARNASSLTKRGISPALRPQPGPP